MAKPKNLFAIVCLVLSVSCIIPPKQFPNRQVALSPKGETILVSTRDQKKVEGEFLFCDEQTVSVLVQKADVVPSEVLEFPYADIQRLKVKTYVNKSWVGFVLGGQLLPAIMLGVEAANYNDGSSHSMLEIAGPLAIWSAVSGLLFLTSSPRQPQLAGDITLDRMTAIQKYARFPYVPTPDQKKIILDGLKSQPSDK